MVQIGLFDGGAPSPRFIPETQREAYQAVDRAEARRTVLDAIRLRKEHGATLFELTHMLCWPVNRVSGRVTELHQAGLIVDSDRRRTNPDSGKKGIVWVTTR